MNHLLGMLSFYEEKKDEGEDGKRRQAKNVVKEWLLHEEEKSGSGLPRYRNKIRILYPLQVQQQHGNLTYTSFTKEKQCYRKASALKIHSI